MLQTELFPQNSYTKALTLKVTVFGNKAYKEIIKVKRGHKGRSISQEGCCPYKKRKRYQSSHSLSLSLSLSFSLHTEARPYEDTARRQPFTNQEEQPPQVSTLIWTSGLQSCEKIHLCSLSHPVCGILLWQT